MVFLGVDIGHMNSWILVYENDFNDIWLQWYLPIYSIGDINSFDDCIIVYENDFNDYLLGSVHYIEVIYV